ncbi:hypothetical protein FSP39_024735 [Pinctada imbricata]|uniref:Uncharacterized protein n=1 Tax=Pinctada imbricata TaxID=66713 RepID=A0AA88YLA1_PINIB|nr:hypothetical protein FSP39_024735 [Pinctada imbricata]
MFVNVTEWENQTPTQVHYNKYMKYIGQSIDKKDFEGLDIEDIHQFERCFEVNVNIFSLQENESVLPVRRSHCHYTNTMNLNLFENHLSYISKEGIKADNIYHWFPRKCCTKHAQRDKRTPGLFKVEFEGD